MRSTRHKRSLAMISPVIDVFLALVIITVATGAMQYFQNESKAKHNPSLDLMAQWEQSVASLQERYEELLRELQRLPSLENLPQADIEALDAARERLLQELAEVRQELARIQAALQETQQKQDQTAQEQQRLLDELANLQQQIEDLEAQIRKLRYDREQIEKLQQELDELLRQLEEALERFNALQEKIAAERAKQAKPAVKVEVHPRVHDSDDLEMQAVVISQATVTPICEPYYRPVYQEIGDFRLHVGLDFVRSGHSASEALRQDSDFMTWLNRIDPNSQYVFMLVDSASFDTFRAVRAELRKRGIASGWRPFEAGNKDFSVGSGGMETPLQ